MQQWEDRPQHSTGKGKGKCLLLSEEHRGISRCLRVCESAAGWRAAVATRWSPETAYAYTEPDCGDTEPVQDCCTGRCGGMAHACCQDWRGVHGMLSVAAFIVLEICNALLASLEGDKEHTGG